MPREATCHCGKLAIRCDGEPLKVSLCHCLDCQRRTGSLFGVAAFFLRDAVSIVDGEPRSYSRPSASGDNVVFRFCGNCGTSLWWEPARMPLLIGVAVGAFADPAFPMPGQAVWAQDRHDWLPFPDDLPTHERNPPPRSPDG